MSLSRGRDQAGTPTTTAQSWGRGAAGPPPRALGGSPPATAQAPTPHGPTLGNQGPHTNLPGQHGLHGGMAGAWKPSERRGAWAVPQQPPPPRPFPQPQSSLAYRTPPVPTGRGGAGPTSQGTASRGHRCLPHPDPRRLGWEPAGNGAAERRRVGSIWGAQAAGPQLWASPAPAAGIARALLHRASRLGLGSTLPALSSHMHLSFTLALTGARSARQLFLITRHAWYSRFNTHSRPATRTQWGPRGASSSRQGASERRCPQPSRLTGS